MSETYGYETKNAWKTADRTAVFNYADRYKNFLNHAKTEREAVRFVKEEAEKNGFVPLSSCETLKTGDKIYAENRGKGILLAVIGAHPVSEGMRIVASHVDCPRLDLKQRPLHEDTEMAYLRTHYYGGIKKYQWVTRPLALHGVVVLKDGTELSIAIGDEGDDFGFVITDLLPHFAREQMKKTLSEGISGEDLQLLCGSVPDKDAEKDAVKHQILSILHDKYGIEEEDLISAELCAVPSENARDIGFDRSFIGGYGQDDRVCSFAAFDALLQTGTPSYTSVCLLVDKEEIGSNGLTGMQSRFFEAVAAELLSKTGTADLLAFNRCLFASSCLSGDVTAGIDPLYASVHEKQNAALIGHGIAVSKFTGAGGKSGASDADARTMGAFRAIMNENEVCWQSCELGKIDAGGGGTISKYMAQLGVATLDAGTPMLSMHAPFEITSKIDAYSTMRAYLAFFQSERAL